MSVFLVWPRNGDLLQVIPAVQRGHSEDSAGDSTLIDKHVFITCSLTGGSVMV